MTSLIILLWACGSVINIACLTFTEEHIFLKDFVPCVLFGFLAPFCMIMALCDLLGLNSYTVIWRRR